MMDWDQLGIPHSSQGLTDTWRAVAGFPETGLQAVFGPMCQFWGSNCTVTVLSLFFRKCHKPVSSLVRRNIPCQVLTVLQNAVFYLG